MGIVMVGSNALSCRGSDGSRSSSLGKSPNCGTGTPAPPQAMPRVPIPGASLCRALKQRPGSAVAAVWGQDELALADDATAHRAVGVARRRVGHGVTELRMRGHSTTNQVAADGVVDDLV